MSQTLLNTINQIKNFSGAKASIELPISRDLINHILSDVQLPKIQSIFIERISNNEMEVLIYTNILFHYKNSIVLQIHPIKDLNDNTLTGEIISGLNQMQRLILSLIVNDNVVIECKKIIVSLGSLIPHQININDYLPILKELKIETKQDKLLLRVEMKVD